MAKYKVTFKKSVAKDLRAIPNLDVKRILLRIKTLAENPRSEGCVKLSSQERYRVRQGHYRIIYEIQEYLLVVQIVKVGHRSTVYEGH
jgi:mRNA interferase RelE/StbE